MKKVLIVRFSSIGDIVLTSPVVRCLNRAGFEVHYLVKENFAGIVRANPHVKKVFTIKKNVAEVEAQLKSENYDFIADLHHNLRSFQVKRMLVRPMASVRKLNVEKWFLVNAKLNFLPALHIVDRYFETVKSLGVKNDGLGLDYFIAAENEVDLAVLPEKFRGGYLAITVGAKFHTKQMPVEKISSIIDRLRLPVVLLGGKEDMARAEQIVASCGDRVFNTCGKFNLDQSASLVKQARAVIAHDTGLMHIAAAFKKKIYSVWGNTVPAFGMYPYLPGEGSKIVEVKDLYCRPCSKIGYKQCPLGHFRCMREIDVTAFDELY